MTLDSLNEDHNDMDSFINKFKPFIIGTVIAEVRSAHPAANIDRTQLEVINKFSLQDGDHVYVRVFDRKNNTMYGVVVTLREGNPIQYECAMIAV